MKTIILSKISILLLFFSLPVLGFPTQIETWTSRERVVEAALSMQTKAESFYTLINSSIAEKVLKLITTLHQFAEHVEGGISCEEAELEHERLAGVYHHVDRAVSDAYNLNFPVMLKWRSVEWAWEILYMNLYGTISN